jgi:putative DNA primase/helicase
MKAGWVRVTKPRPCPVCGKDHACKVSTDGAVIMCRRVEAGAFEVRKGGWFMHRFNGDAQNNGHAPKNANGTAVHVPTRAAATKGGRSFATGDQAIAAAVAGVRGGRLAAVWTYSDAAGVEVMRVARINTEDGGKEFRPVHRSKSGWKIGDPSGPLPLYNLQALTEATTVYVTEGEKAADAARGIGLVAVTSAHGAAAAEKTDWRPLAGKELIILRDNDDDGLEYARAVERIGLELDPPAKVKTVLLPGLADKGDIADWVAERPDADPVDLGAEVAAIAASVPWSDPSAVIGGPVLVSLADIEPQDIEWLWERRLALGKLAGVQGDPGLGKSFLTLDMTARVSTGTPWPDGTPCPLGSVLLIGAEDDLADTIRPRLDAAGADPRKIVALEAVARIGEDGKPVPRGFTLADMPALTSTLRRMPDCKLVVIDPISAYLADTDSHNNAEIRGLLAPLAKLAAAHRVAVVMVTHQSKSGGSRAMYRSMGSLAFVAAARSAWLVVKDKDNPRRRLFLPVKNNIGNDRTGLAFTVADHMGHGVVEWERGEVTTTADEALAAEAGADEGTRGPAPDARLAAERWLRELLKAGPVAVKTVQAEVKAAGMSWATVRRASDVLKVAKEKTRDTAVYHWRLPAPSLSELVAQAGCSSSA